MLSKEEIKIFNDWQYYDKHRAFPDEVKRTNLMIKNSNKDRLKSIAKSRNVSVSKIVNEAIEKSLV